MVSESFANGAFHWLSAFDEPGLGYQVDAVQALRQELVRQNARITKLEQEQAAFYASRSAQIETE